MEPVISRADMDANLATGTAHTWDRLLPVALPQVVQLHGHWWQLNEDDHYRPVTADLAAILTDYHTRLRKADQAIEQQGGAPGP